MVISLHGGAAPLTLQATMCCYHEEGECKAFWEFSFDGCILLLDSENIKWIEGHPECRLIRKVWENRDMNTFYKKISEGDCHGWLEKFFRHWEKMLELTGK